MSNPIHNVKFVPDKGRFVAKKRVISVWTVFKDNGDWSIYHCPDCRNPISQYKGDVIAEIPGGVSHSYPVMIQCKNPKCGRKIMFVDATKQVNIND